ncbi:nucleolar complex protein 3 homolog [Panulirus ornatus]|uniref:nucleolar complex protein 3 homolog n=1 Tax=Panulirus ornatus TaxID=150431 RepID=UPI003A837127
MAKRGKKLAKKTKKKGLSVFKMANIQSLKRSKRGELTEAERKKRKIARKEKRKLMYTELHNKRRKMEKLKEKYASEEEIYPLHAEVTGEDMLEMIDPEDLEYFAKSKTKKTKIDDDENDGCLEALENEVRSFDKDKGENMKELLPYKTEQGIVPRYIEVKEKVSMAEDELLPSIEEEKEEEETEEMPKEKSAVDFMVERQRNLEEKKIAIGCLASNFLLEPENKLPSLTKLVDFMEDSDPDVAITVKKYAALSLLKIFNNIIPAYPLHEHNLAERLKKETKQLYEYENRILSTYQTYLKNLENMLKEEKKNKTHENQAVKHTVVVALKCMGDLLTRHPHFNYTFNIIHALVPYLNHSDDDIYSLVASSFAKVFKADKQGHLSLEVVRCINNYVRRKAFRVQPEILKVLLSLKMKDFQNVDAEIEAKLNERKKLTHEEKLLKKLIDENRAKKSKKDTKIIRKKRKLEEQKKDILKGKVTKQRNAQHSKIIQLIFGLYIHVLKRQPNKRLIGVVLEGLAKFAHLINIEFFVDLLNVLGALMDEGSLKFQESLHCIQVVFTILSGQGEVLTLDPYRFYKYLYANMFRMSAGANHDDVTSVLESLNQMLVEHRRRANPLRVYAFTKRLATLSLTLLHNGTIASLSTLRSIMLNHPSTETLLETDMEGSNGIFSAEIEEPEHCNANATSMWELHILKRHYHSIIQQMSEHVLCGVPLQGEKILPPTLTKRSVEELFKAFDPSEMRFNPAIPAPNQHLSSRLSSKIKWHAKRRKGEQWCTQYMMKETKALKMAGLLKSQVNVNSFSTNVNGLCKENGVSSGQTLKKPRLKKLRKVNFFSGMLSNMNIDKIPVRKTLHESNDFTRSFLIAEPQS